MTATTTSPRLKTRYREEIAGKMRPADAKLLELARVLAI